MKQNILEELDNLKLKYEGSKLIEAKELLIDFIETYPQFDNQEFKVLIGQFVEDENGKPLDKLFVHIIHPDNYNTQLVPITFQEYKVINWSREFYEETFQSPNLIMKSHIEFKAVLLNFIANSNLHELEELKKILIDEANIIRNYPSSPGKPNLTNIKSIGETAFQRGIFNSGETLLDCKNSNGLERIKWLDLELPVTFNKNARRCCLDLIGSLDDIPVICELKFRKPSKPSKSNHPLYGVVELLIYYYLIYCNYKKLEEHKIHHQLDNSSFTWSDFAKNETPLLLLVANKSYWTYWLNRKDINKTELFQKLSELGKRLGLNIHLFEAEDIDFLKQKGNNETYKPDVTSKIWTKINYEN